MTICFCRCPWNCNRTLSVNYPRSPSVYALNAANIPALRLLLKHLWVKLVAQWTDRVVEFFERWRMGSVWFYFREVPENEKKKQNKLVDWNKLTNLILKSNYSGNVVVPASMTALKGWSWIAVLLFLEYHHFFILAIQWEMIHQFALAYVVGCSICIGAGGFLTVHFSNWAALLLIGSMLWSAVL